MHGKTTIKKDIKICVQHTCTFLKLKQLHVNGVPLWLVYLKAGLPSITRQLTRVMSYGQHTRSGLHVVFLGLRATVELEHRFHVSPQTFHSVILLLNVKPSYKLTPFNIRCMKLQATMQLSKYKIQNSGQMLKFLSYVASSNSTSHHHLAVDTSQCSILTAMYLKQQDKQALPNNLVPPRKNYFLSLPLPHLFFI
jgi:hypothetical protein